MRADAQRSIATILDAALELLAARPDASMADVAAAAGVARQTVYAHYASRAALLAAVAGRARDQTLAALDTAAPEDGPPAEALDRLTAAWWESVERNARALATLAPAFADAADVHDFHVPILDRVEQLVRRGQAAGAFDRELPVTWLAAAFLGLMHTAADAVAAGRLDSEQAGRALRRSVPPLFGVTGSSLTA
jgi:AcrR family transcriptional regulator